MKAKKLTKPNLEVPAKELSGIYQRIREILESARVGMARTVNTTQVVANWLIGREIVLGEQAGERRARYGSRLLEGLASRLKEGFGDGYSAQNLRYMRQFHSEYPHLLDHSPIRHTLCGDSKHETSNSIRHTVCGKSEPESWANEPAEASKWVPGLLHTGLAWSLYRHLLKVDSPAARAFYEIEAIKNNWSARELERQINSLLFERLAKSKDKAGLMKLATKGQEITAPADVFKDPVVIEFLGLPESPRLVESNLEQALINNLQDFLLELGKGFAFVSRQERITLDGDHFYIDLVFYPYDDNSKVIPENKLKASYPNTYRYLESQRHLLSGRPYFDKSTKRWFEIWNQRNKGNFGLLRIVTPEISDRNHFAITDKYFGNTKTYHIIPKDKSLGNYFYLTALLNSCVLEFYYQAITTPQAGGFFAYKTQFLELLPIKPPSSPEVSLFSKLVPLIQFAKADAGASPGAAAFLEDLIDACVMESYFREHMADRDLLFQDTVAPHLAAYAPEASAAQQRD